MKTGAADAGIKETDGNKWTNERVIEWKNEWTNEWMND